ncbi:MAG: DUF5110 domain-containing protein [Clostridia bacterium]|jgi:hypothetical protein|nr:DUF5110 domain-containing protein [Clostridia bacterium]
MEQIIYGNIRVQLLSENIVRIEYGKNGAFCDENTFFIPNRTAFTSGVSFTQEAGVICFGEYVLYLPANAQSLKGVRLEKNGKKVYTYEKLANSGELPALDQTPEVFALSDTPRIIVPEGGYSKERKGEYVVEENVEDIYLLLCEGDAKKLRKLFVELTGKCELVRLSTLGGWNSKYYAYSEEEAKQLILDYEAHEIPLDVMVIDTDWRSCENGWGYDINEKLFPDMKRFLNFAHEHGVEVMFNDHPEPVNGAQVFAPEEIAYREKNLQSLMEKGLDIWWYDRNWGTHLISPSEDVYWETFGLYLFEDITRHYYQKQSGDKQVYRRPVIMGNAVNVVNGNYMSIADSASHRYSIQWTGDISCRLDSLSQEVASLIRGGNNCVPYINADCGGHLGNPNKMEFVRWMQFGTLSPVFRPHCTNIVERTRDPWVYDEETENIVREYNNLRYRLLPVIYKNAYNSYETGEPIFKSLGFEYPDDKTALSCTDEYLLGNNLLFAPIGAKCPMVLEKEDFLTPVKATYYNGRELKGDPIAHTEYEKLDFFLNHTSPEAGVPVYDFSARFEAVVKFYKAVQLCIKCDDGATVWVDGKKVLEDKTLHSALLFPLCEVSADKEHKIEIEYFQAGGEACCSLCYYETEQSKGKSCYLPAGKWLDAFTGQVHEGGDTVARKYALLETPLFVRLGALLPLAHEARNTQEQKWDRIIYDFYPDKDATDEGYLYEDDTETTAYKQGMYRKSTYKAGYCDAYNAYVVNLSKADGSFAGEKCFAEREITFKVHTFDEQIKRVTVNGEEVSFKTVRKNVLAFPLNAGEAAPDSDTMIVTVTTQVERDYEIKFYL